MKIFKFKFFLIVMMIRKGEGGAFACFASFNIQY